MGDKTISCCNRGRWNVHEFDTYPRHSVLAGQTRKKFVTSYETEAEAIAAHPDADRGFRSAHNSFGHLPGENDMVPGGALPDDYSHEDRW